MLSIISPSDNGSHDVENFETTSQQTRNVTEKWDAEDEKDDVEDSSADDDEEETTEQDSKSENEANQLPEKKPLVESTAESEAQQKNEEEKKARVKDEKKELTGEEKLTEKIWIKIQEHADDFEQVPAESRDSIDNWSEENEVTDSSADSDEEESSGKTESQTYLRKKEILERILS